MQNSILLQLKFITLELTECFFILGLLWGQVYAGPALEHVCDGLKPGCCYQARLYCISEGGQSPVSHYCCLCLTTTHLKRFDHFKFNWTGKRRYIFFLFMYILLLFYIIIEILLGLLIVLSSSFVLIFYQKVPDVL